MWPSNKNFRRWSPVAGNAALPAQPFHPKAPDLSASVPLPVGNTLNEFLNAINKPDAFKLTQAELENNVRNAYGDRAAKILEVYQAGYPNANNFQLWSVIGAISVRSMSLEQARPKAAVHAAAVYRCRFDLADSGSRWPSDGIPLLGTGFCLRQHDPVSKHDRRWT